MPTNKTTAKKTTKAKKVVKKTTKKVAKKVVKKATKKVVKKVASKKKTAKADLVYSSDDTSFWVSDGQVLNNLLALRDALDSMSKEVYKFHSGGKQNDFANWVEVVLCDGKCANNLRKAKTQRSAKTVVVKHLKYYAV